MTKPAPEYREYALRDASRVLVRPIRPEDEDRLQEVLRRMSEQSRYYRFMSPVKRLSKQQLRYFTDLDQERHVAWIALDPSAPGLPALGVARYVRLETEPKIAEAAVAVVDSHHGRGLGTILLGLLATTAAGNGIRQFRAYVLAGNRAMLDLFRDLGAVASLEEESLYRVDMAIPETPQDLPDTAAGRVFRAVARQEMAFPHPTFHRSTE